MAARSNKFESFEHVPTVSSHEIGRNNKTGSILGFLRFNKYRFIPFDSIVNKIIYFVWYLFSIIKKNLFLIILPIQSEVFYTNIVPMIIQLSPCSINNSGDFIRYNKFQILSSNLITNKQSVFNLDDADVIIFYLFLLLFFLLVEIDSLVLIVVILPAWVLYIHLNSKF